MVGVAVAATLAALSAKAWCGLPASTHDLYLRWCYSDIPALFFAERLHVGAIPYLDHPVEYPVLTGAAMWLAALPVDTASGFLWATGALLIFAAGVTAWLLGREVGPVRALAFAAAPTLVVSGAVNWDLPAVALATAGLVAHRRGRDGLAGVALGLGTATKLFPGLFVLPVVAAAARLRGRRAAVAAALGAAVAWTSVNLPMALAAPQGWWRFFELSLHRAVDWDALWFVAGRLLVGRSELTVVNVASGALFLLGSGLLAWWTMRHDPPATWHLAALPLVAWFLLTSKVYSPQFSLWLLPLFALAWPGWRLWGAFAVADLAVTATRFPYLAEFVDDDVGAWPYEPFGAAVVVRAVVLLTVAVTGWRRGVHGWRDVPGQHTAGETERQGLNTGRRDVDNGRRDVDTGRRDVDHGRRDVDTGRPRRSRRRVRT